MFGIFEEPYYLSGDEIDTSTTSLVEVSKIQPRRHWRFREDPYIRLSDKLRSQSGEFSDTDPRIMREINIGLFSMEKLTHALHYVVHNRQAVINRRIREYRQADTLNLIRTLGSGLERPFDLEEIKLRATHDVGELATRAELLVIELPTRQLDGIGFVAAAGDFHTSYGLVNAQPWYP